jgi:hypothetical protein
MGQFESFADVLEKKIRREIEEEILAEVDAWGADDTALSSAQNTRLDNSPDCLGCLLGVVEPLRQNPQTKAHLYHKHRSPPPPRPAHALSPAQQKALHFFIERGSALADNYALKDLKSEFRKLALKLHPDRPHGSAAQFIQLKAAFDQLRLIFIKNEPQISK